jgi:pyruvate dehydrogenase E1 component alpha subunit
MKTYRYRGHSMSDPAKYRTREEVQQMREKHDPIDTFGARLVREGIVREDELKAYDRDVRQVINHAAEFATESPEPALEELYTDILK